MTQLQPGTTYAAIIGRILVMKRDELFLEQADVARSMGLSQSSWSRIERGDSVINVEQLFAVSAVLQSSPSEILNEADRVVESLRSRNVEVQTAKQVKNNGGALALIGLGALAALVIGASSKK